MTAHLIAVSLLAWCVKFKPTMSVALEVIYMMSGS